VAIFVVAALAFLGVTLLGLGLFGRPDQGRPTCRACNADARPAAWDSPPVCACGARLDRAGAVRTRGRMRRRAVVALGVVVTALAIGAGGVSRWIRDSGRTWYDFLPMSIVLDGLRDQSSWAHETVLARRARGSLDDVAFADAVIAANGVPPPFSDEHEQFLGVLRAEWIAKPFDVDRLVPQFLGFDLSFAPVDAETPSTPTDGITLCMTALLTGAIPDQGRAWLFRLTRITVDGAEVPFNSEVLSGRTSRVLIAGSPGARFSLSGSARTDNVEATVVVEGYLVLSAVGLAAVGDPLIDSAAPCEEWAIDAVTIPIRREFRIARDGAITDSATGASP
jgi:hypothetical protein